ncbi:MAG: NAD(P)/FAD-dependent oxidoreductase [Candidatus Parvarchaeota archaeon]|nr:NAD(P)/FAD-dependent oxidoreductase [Candidatus Parvarchaeota archaeon]
MEETDLVIVGAGPTGLFATFCAGLREINSVTLEVSGTYGGQITELYPQKIVYDMPGILKIKGADLSKQMYEQAVLLNKKILFNSGVTDIIPTDDKQFIIEVNGKQTYKTKAVLLCPGIGRFEPNKLNVEGEDKYKDKGVFYSVKDPNGFKGKKTLIVGGGDSAFDYANQIVDVSAGVVIAQHNNVLKAAEEVVDNTKKNSKVEIKLNTVVIGIYGDDNSVKSVKLKDVASGKEYSQDFDAVVIAAGQKTNPNMFKSLKLDNDGRYVKTDNNYKTSMDGIYAAGDAANVRNEPRFALLAVGTAEAYIAINNIKKYVSPSSGLFGEHSSNMKL